MSDSASDSDGGRFQGFRSDRESEDRVGSVSSDGGGIDTSDITTADWKAREIYILHRDGGYRFTSDGLIGSLTRQERELFFRGFQTEEKIQARREQAKHSKSGGASQGDHAAFEEYADEVNSPQSPDRR